MWASSPGVNGLPGDVWASSPGVNGLPGDMWARKPDDNIIQPKFLFQHPAYTGIQIYLDIRQINI